eukprot:5459125-Lingulodinium_polyedra.AAC.1
MAEFKEDYDQFWDLRKMVVNAMVEASSHNVRINWRAHESMQQQLLHKTATETSIEEPDDFGWQGTTTWQSTETQRPTGSTTGSA